MKQEEWNEVDDLLQDALNQAPGDRAAFLDRACDGRDSIRREVESLLAHHDQAQSFLEEPPGEIAAEFLTSGRSRFLNGQFISHYQVIEWLGAGGMGEVYLARDARLNRHVAIKVLPAHFTSDSDKVRRFEQEARAASALNHPNIVTIYEVGQVDGAHFIVAEYIDGETLRQRLARGAMNVGEALDVAAQVANALDRAHAVGIVHRDIKPDNIMLRPDGLVKVLDFGLAKLSEPITGASGDEDLRRGLTNPGVVMGTARYMSPEQAMGQNVDARTDIWSLGVVLFEMLAGKAPFDGETPSHVIVDVLDNAAPALAAYVKEAPPGLESIVRKSLCKNLDERYPTAKEFADDLTNLRGKLQDRGRLNQPLTAAANRPLTKAAYGWKRMATAIAATLVLAAGVFHFSAKPDKSIHSVAVTPFVNGGDATTEDLSKGISEGIEELLSNVPQLQIKKAFQNKNAAVNPTAIGRKLGVRAVLTGRVVPHGDDLEIQADLVDADNAAHLWGETYRGRRIDLPSVQVEIAAAVSRLVLQSGVAQPDTNSKEAYTLYLQGRFYWAKSEGKAAPKMLEFFQKAIDIDPNFGLAYAGMADYYAEMGLSGYIPGDEAWTKSEDYAVQALARRDSAEGHMSLAAVRIWHDRKWWQAEKELKRAIELKPEFAEAHDLYAKALDATGRFDEAVASEKRAKEADPYKPHRGGENLGVHYFHARRYDLAAAEFLKDINREPGNGERHISLAEVYVQQRKLKDALDEARSANALIGSNRKLATRLGAVFAAAGDAEEATKILVEANQLETKRPHFAYLIASIHAALGNNREAIAWLNRSIDEFDANVIALNVDPRFDPIRQDPSFRALLGRMNLLP
jgi:serine/threonine-protein kinase